MINNSYTIELYLKPGCNPDLGESEFSRALVLPRKIFYHEFHLLSLRYLAHEKDLAVHHCSVLNDELKKLGYTAVEFKIKDLH